MLSLPFTFRCLSLCSVSRETIWPSLRNPGAALESPRLVQHRLFHSRYLHNRYLARKLVLQSTTELSTLLTFIQPATFRLTCNPQSKEETGTVAFYFLGQCLICTTLNDNCSLFSKHPYQRRGCQLSCPYRCAGRQFLCQQEPLC